MKQVTIGVALLALVSGSTTRVYGQEVASSFEQLRVLVEPGDRITVVDASGAELKGRVEQLSDAELTLMTGTGRLRFDEAKVGEIRQRRDDSLLNGAIIGAVAGTAYFVTAAALLSDSDGGDVILSSAIAGGILFAGMGAGAGAGIDALIRRQHVIYQRMPGRASLAMAPLFGGGRRGAVLSVRF